MNIETLFVAGRHNAAACATRPGAHPAGRLAALPVVAGVCPAHSSHLAMLPASGKLARVQAEFPG